MPELELDGDLQDKYRKFVESWAMVQAECHELCMEKGFWEQPRNVGEMLALIHSEISEAMEVYREGHPLSGVWLSWKKDESSLDAKRGKPEGFGTELADAVLRIMDLCEAYHIPLAQRLVEKMDFNRSRGHKHGKNC